jgi:Gamma-glutamyl cyclotransferase, AIG2-like
MVQYIFGYGSLIELSSRAATGETGQMHPVRVANVQRAWHVVSPNGYTLVGVTSRPGASCNGVLVQVQPHVLPHFDQRERRYHRVMIPQQSVTSLSGERLSSATIWAYVTSRPGEPSHAYPLVQSYIDVILTGCLAIGLDFAVEFIETTSGWESTWLNDRRHPRYVRALAHSPQANDIDRQLQALVPHAFLHRRDPTT